MTRLLILLFSIGCTFMLIITILLLQQPKSVLAYLLSGQTSVKKRETIIITTGGNYLSYENSTYGIKINYPPDWVYLEGNSGLPLSTKYTIVTFVLPMSKLNGSFPVALTIAIQNLPFHNFPLDLYTQLYIKTLTQSYSDLRIIESNTTHLAGNTAHKIVFSRMHEKVPVKAMTVFTIRGDRVYLIGFIAKAENYSNYLSTVQKMVESLKLLYPATNSQVYSVVYYPYHLKY